METNGWTTEQLAALRGKLPQNYGNIVADRTGKSRVHVYQVANGKAYNADTMQALVELAEENLKKIRKTATRIDKLKVDAA
ncbi:hypothetical protein UFOVP350_39 [uncultured Caudovirales phage]|uniref:Uncharacterized protein n=1 Tax=uncultured Caudovirales phage TaxID=2100421 RepID=A0A6J5M0J2_9CAUD|nr:hypothetical protein UFOVP350_39 [uncultured Caudovirales phage]